MSPRAYGTRTPPEQKHGFDQSTDKKQYQMEDQSSIQKHLRLPADPNQTQDGDSAMKVTKAPTENSYNWMKSVSGVSGSKTMRDD